MSQATQVFNPHPQPSNETAEEQAEAASSGVATPTAMRAAPSMATSAVIVGLAFVMSRILGLGREVILANAFGTGREMDAYVSAFRIPDLLFLVVMAGSFGAAFIPVFGEYLTNGDQERAWRLASAVLTWAGIGVLVMSAVCFVLARPLMFLVAPGFDDETADMAVNLMRILLLSPVFLGFGIAAKGILEAHHQFTLPALAPLLYNVAIIIGALFFVEDHGIYAVGWAVIIGALGHFLIQVPGLLRAGIRFRPTISRQVEGLGEVTRLLGPRVIGSAAFQFNFIAVNAFASTSADEHVSAINYAWQLLMLPHGVLALSISTVVFPSLAALYSHGDNDGFRSMLDRALRPLLFLSVPAGIGLLLLREPIVRVIFESGDFDRASTRLVIAPLAWFAFGLIGYALTEILTRVFYATRDTRTPVVTGVLTVILNLLLCMLFIDTLGYTGLALALSATTSAEAVILLLFLRERIGPIFSPGFTGWMVRVAAAGAVMAAIILVTAPTLERVLEADGSSRIQAYLLFVYAMGLYVLSFVLAAYMLRIPELQQMTGKVARRLPGGLRHPLERIGLA
ncbi:MAG TPA: murein biosynthesis integral membrane protein MurJ [Thermomicrobiales bacterium]|nr:murein biosynthesis integral membrane protein MurJ [Thermomicrobiales bacterium]